MNKPAAAKLSILERIDDVAVAMNSFVVRHPDLILRMCATVLLWGAALYACFGMSLWALGQKIPPVEKQAAEWVEQLDASLAELVKPLGGLQGDSRVAAGLTGDEQAEVGLRRALYETGFLNDLPNLFIWSGTNGRMEKLASADAPSKALEAWLSGLEETDTLALVGEGDFLVIAMRLKGALPKSYAVLRLGLSATLFNLPLPPSLYEQPGAGFGLEFDYISASGELGKAWQTLHQRGPAVPFADSGLSRTAQDLTSNLLIDAPLSVKGWQAGYTVNPLTFVGNMLSAQLAVLALAALATFMLFRTHIAHHSQATLQKVQVLTKPLRKAIHPLIAPALDVLANMGKPKDVIDLVQLGDLSPRVQVDSGLASAGYSRGRAGVVAEPVQQARASSRRVGGERSAAYVPPAPDLGGGRTKSTKKHLENYEANKMVREALETDGVQLHFQPIFDLRTGLPIAHEVLARLHNENGEPIGPDVFMQAAKDGKLMGDIDLRVLELAFIKLRETNVGDIVLSLNISAQTMAHIGYMQRLIDAENQPLLKKLILEITSRELLGDTNSIRFLKDCQKLGLKLAVDYFGGGTPMIEGAAKLKLNYVKLDARRFEGLADTSAQLMNLGFAAKKFGIPLILEKIETVEIEVIARKAGISFAQGYLFAKPTEKPSREMMPGWRESLAREGDIKNGVNSETKHENGPA